VPHADLACKLLTVTMPVKRAASDGKWAGARSWIKWQAEVVTHLRPRGCTWGAADTCGGESGLRARLEGSGLLYPHLPKLLYATAPKPQVWCALPGRVAHHLLSAFQEVLQRDLTAPTNTHGPRRSPTPWSWAATYGVCHLLAAVEASRMPGGRPARRRWRVRPGRR